MSVGKRNAKTSVALHPISFQNKGVPLAFLQLIDFFSSDTRYAFWCVPIFGAIVARKIAQKTIFRAETGLCESRD